MDESLRFTIVYEDGGEGWTMARIVEVPGAMSQGGLRAYLSRERIQRRAPFRVVSAADVRPFGGEAPLDGVLLGRRLVGSHASP
jgi:hypothetical protein